MIRDTERESIRLFLEINKAYLAGSVLDFGSGLQPYKDLCGQYTPHEKGDQLEGHYDTILCTQVLEYIADPLALLKTFRSMADTLVMTYPTHWEEVESNDLWRFTKAGMERLLNESGWKVIKHEPRHYFECELKLCAGYGVIAT